MGTVLGKINVETPKYVILDKGNGFEVREYNPCIVAEVSYDPTEMKSGRDGGFMILASYIGAVGQPKNEAPQGSAQKIAMTAPVITKESDSNGNVVLVKETESERSGSRLVTMQFVLPSYLTLETAPRPTDPRVRLEAVPQRKYGVLGFSGVANDALVQEKIRSLKTKLEESGYKVIGDYILARYNPPWTPGFLRTNEVMFPVQ